MSTYGVTYSALEPHMRWAGSLSAYASDVLTHATQSGRYVDAQLARLGYEPDEVAARDSADPLFALCAEIVVLRSAAALVSSLTGQDTTIAAALIARSAEQVARIVAAPSAEDRAGWDTERNAGGVRVALKDSSEVSGRFWSPGRRT